MLINKQMQVYMECIQLDFYMWEVGVGDMTQILHYDMSHFKVTLAWNKVMIQKVRYRRNFTILDTNFNITAKTDRPST